LIDLIGTILIIINVYLLVNYYKQATSPSTNPWITAVTILPSLMIAGILLWARRKFGPYKV
jgi:hypothetical protein